MTAIVPKKRSVGREVLRERERLARERRAVRLEAMQGTLDALECAALVVHTLGDEEAVWEDFLDADAMRVRRFMAQSLELSKKVSALQLEKDQLNRMLREHQLLVRVLNNMQRKLDADDVARQQLQSWEMEESPDAIQTVQARPSNPRTVGSTGGQSNSWEWCIVRQRELTRQHFQPWTLEDCQEQVAAAMKVVDAFHWSEEKQTTGATFLGWRDQQRMDDNAGVFQFEFNKTFRGFDMRKYVAVSWDTYATSATFQEVIIGHRLLGTHEVIQRIGPDMMIVRICERFPAFIGDVHIVYLVFRIKTDRGWIQYVRSICCPELVSAIGEPHDVWPSNFLWSQWEQLDGEDNAFTVRIGGSMHGKDVNYAKKWMLEGFGCVLRCERLSTGRQLIKSE